METRQTKKCKGCKKWRKVGKAGFCTPCLDRIGGRLFLELVEVTAKIMRQVLYPTPTNFKGLDLRNPKTLDEIRNGGKPLDLGNTTPVKHTIPKKRTSRKSAKQRRVKR